MASSIHRLRAEHLKKRRGPDKLCDGGGLWLFISKTGAKSWVFRYRFLGIDREMGLGSFNELSVSQARQEAQRYRELKKNGVDPIRARNTEIQTAREKEAKRLTFADCALRFIESKEDEWKNQKHRQQWRNTLRDYAFPVIGDTPVSEVDTELVLQVLEPIWKSKTETATRVRQRIQAVLDWARAKGYRSDINPAIWKGHLENLLPIPSKIKTVQHHNALPYKDVPAFFTELGAQDTVSARALEFLILTATRTGEVIGAKWDEINLDDRIWEIPGARMKPGRSHRVPLPRHALSLVKSLHQEGDYLFPGMQSNKPLSNMAMAQLLKRMRHTNITVHGFRSTFRDWCAEQTTFPREVAESALAHVLSDKTEAAYQRGDYLDKRRELMNSWARYLSEPKGKVVSIRKKMG